MFCLCAALTIQNSLELSGYHGDTGPQSSLSNDLGDPLGGRGSKRSYGPGKGEEGVASCVYAQLSHLSLVTLSLVTLSLVTHHHSTICHPSLWPCLSNPLSPDDSKKFLSKFKKLMTGNTNDTTTFGVPLEACPLSETHPFVPKVMDLCITEIEQRGLQCEGLYRWVGQSEGCIVRDCTGGWGGVV